MVFFKTNLAFFREKNKQSNVELGKLLGIGRDSIARWEDGGSFPTLKTFFQLVEIYRIDPIDFLYRDLRIYDVAAFSQIEAPEGSRQDFEVSANTMSPTLVIGDILVAEKIGAEKVIDNAVCVVKTKLTPHLKFCRVKISGESLEMFFDAGMPGSTFQLTDIEAIYQSVRRITTSGMR